MVRIKEQAYFLATTALEEFWDTTKPIIFRGECCLLYRSFWEQIEGKLLESPFENPEVADAAYNYEPLAKLYIKS